MKKIMLIIQREYLSRVKKKSFILMTIFGPVLIALGLVIVTSIMIQQKTVSTIAVVDESNLFVDSLAPSSQVKFIYPDAPLQQVRNDLYKKDYTGVLYIPGNILGNGKILLFYKKPPGIGTEMQIKSSIEKRIFDYKLMKDSIDRNVIAKAKTSVDIRTIKVDETGKEAETKTTANMGVGIAACIIIMFFIFLYGVQVMRSVIEEKTSRIVEVIISSVKPFQLMMGKIIGVAMVGLTQFILWVVLTFGLYAAGSVFFLKDIKKDMATQEMYKEEVFRKGADIKVMQNAPRTNSPDELMGFMKGLESIDFVAIIFCFAFYFLGGYLLYASLFAATGAAVDNEAETQQFMIPVMMPLIFTYILSVSTISSNPEGPWAYWLSIIPFTSPVAMMIRLPFGVPVGDLVLSMVLLVLGFVFTTWIAGRIYRTGILMYGKKVSYKEIGKWLFYKG
jgi:ABC-2 type transport system permease protein